MKIPAQAAVASYRIHKAADTAKEVLLPTLVDSTHVASFDLKFPEEGR